MKNSTKTEEVSFRHYRYDAAMSLPYRLAHALDWAAVNYGALMVAYNKLLQAVMGYGHLPRTTSKEVESLRQRMSRVREILNKDYSRGLVTEPGLGCRATSDALDAMKNDVAAQVKRHTAAGKRLVRASANVDINSVPNTRENQRWIKWFKTDVRQQVVLFQSADFLRKLLPPVDADADAAADATDETNNAAVTAKKK